MLWYGIDRGWSDKKAKVAVKLFVPEMVAKVSAEAHPLHTEGHKHRDRKTNKQTEGHKH